ncbi:hypothetical protein PR202_gb03968 [Eleusine coracana subsp. coracana]|uniref:Bifunctional inhibitor/plant lipid transfer protein/seed storage helical domain-containing protein n=1 Tax=Eleusine coracana subsp. coracana TaxID=191504 RepID=A0AAV5E3C2_ELECO|nr:hypothetical protein QOZ80_1BG0094240 [Eleusine coracana subsp. coracana]GJN16939.1 hypothetical protein PR202_gb03968 [Eleusine coracana subsp. coracana]
MATGMMKAALMVSLLIVAAAASAGAISVCGVDESAMEACRSFCEVGSTVDAPSALCCDGLKNARFSCLCKYKSYLPDYIDANRVMMIPAACHIRAPPNLCN